jgi:hypothetical protein
MSSIRLNESTNDGYFKKSLLSNLKKVEFFRFESKKRD